ncbi:unnamed protein product [Candidula unifasciata]|uniref:OTU domain-containing protein n=1 Tax=Candidula unifasciata TaxID=100452 RepID=A0A8S3Z931_9EUPU|nr:unnamed protein product [Candidula unifasciata]
MVSVDRFSALENDRFINHHSGIGGSFPGRLHPHFSSLFDDDLSIVLRNPKTRTPNSVFSVGPAKHAAITRNDSELFPKHSFQEFDDISSLDAPAWMTSVSPKSNNKFVSRDKPYLDSELKSHESSKSKANDNIVDSPVFDSQHNLPLSTLQHNSCGGQLENWTTIPIKHIESSTFSVSDEDLDSNNNSSRRRYSSTPRSRASSKVKYDRENSNDGNIQSQSNRFRKANPAYHTSASSEQNQSRNDETNNITSAIKGDLDSPEFEQDEVVSPPHCQVYHDLKIKLAHEDRKIDYIEGDGNCLFRALSKGIYGSEKYHKAMRMFIVNLIGTNKSKFAQFVDDEDVEEHINRMCKDGCWATTCEIYAAATLLQRDIFMLTPDHMNEKYSWLLFQPVFKINEALSVANTHPCYITLCNTNGNHYDRIVPDHGGCNCFLPHPELDGLSTDSTTSADTSSAGYVTFKH